MDRKRAARACDECRRLKEKCEGGVPCRRCSHFQRQCEFKGLAPRAREFRPYIPRERVDRSDFQEQIERCKYMERILRRTIEGIRLDTKSLARLADALDADVSDAKEVEGLVIDEEACTMDPVGDTTTHFSGEFSYWNFSMRVKDHIEKQMEGSGNMIQGSEPVADFPRAHHLRPGRAHLSAAISSCPPRQIADFLARTFFKYAETHYFFVGQSWCLEKMNMLYSHPASFIQKGGEVVISIILMIFAIGTQYAHLESSFRHSTQVADSNFAEEDIGIAFYQQAIRLLPEIIELSSLESVQACLLLGYYALPIDASGLGYIYINLGIRLAMQNGMHRKCKNNAFSPTMIETRNRVWWTVYSLERKISIFHGRPLSVLRADIDATMPLHQPNLDLGDSHESVARAEASIQLINYLEDLFIEVNALRSGQKQQIPKVIKSLLVRKMALKTWWDSLPETMLSDKAEPETHIRSILHLKLEYCLVRMFIGRPFLLKKEPSGSIGVSPTDSEISIPDNNPGKESRKETYITGRQSLVDDCIEAATEALEICQDLRDNRAGLARASYIEYSSCRASLLVLIAYSIQNFSEQFRKLLYNGLDMIREMSAAGESARSEVSLIEMLERALARLHTSWHNSQLGSNIHPETGISDYDAFKHWGARLREATGMDTPGSTTSGMPSQERPLLPSEKIDTDAQMAGTGYTDMGPGLGGDFDVGMLAAFDSVLEMSIFGPENSSPSAAWPTWTEAQVLEHFLTNPEFEGSPELMHT